MFIFIHNYNIFIYSYSYVYRRIYTYTYIPTYMIHTNIKRRKRVYTCTDSNVGLCTLYDSFVVSRSCSRPFILELHGKGDVRYVKAFHQQTC